MSTERQIECHSILEFCREARPNILLITELSRFGRSTVEILKALEHLTAACVNVYLLNLSTLDKDKQDNLVAKMVLTALALRAEMEKKLILGRLNSGCELTKKKRCRFPLFRG